MNGRLSRIAGVAVIAATVSVGIVAQGPSQLGLEEVFADYWGWRLADSPELATFMGRTDYNDRWTDVSKAARDKRRAEQQEYLQKALYFAPGTLNASQKLSVALLEYELRDDLDNGPYLEVIQTVSQSDGFHNDIFETIDAMPSRSVKDYENIVTRMRKVPTLVDQTIELLREQIAAGQTQPATVVTMMLDQMEAQSRPAAADSPLLDAFKKFPATVPSALPARSFASPSPDHQCAGAGTAGGSGCGSNCAQSGGVENARAARSPNQPVQSLVSFRFARDKTQPHSVSPTGRDFLRIVES